MKAALAVYAASFLSTVAAVQKPVIVQGQEFVDTATENRVFVIGVDYQPGGQAAYGTGTDDPLSNATACLRDAALMQQLGINTIRSYNVNPTLNHDECVSIFNDVGIYMIIDVNSPLSGQSLDRGNPSGSYNSGYLNHIFSVVEAFKSYPNLIGFFAGNEIINDIPSAGDNPPYIRAVQRDLKEYIKNHADRQIPVGYSAADVRQVLQDTWAYLQCNNSQNGVDMSRSDFFGLNSYSWCGEGATFDSSGYNSLVDMFANTTIPVFFSEYGCNVPEPRYFNEVQALYGPQMTVLSGGLVYEWSQEVSDFGLVQINDNATIDVLQDYVTLQGQYDKLNVTLLQSGNSTAAALTPPECSSDLISNDGFSTDFKIPDTPAGGQQMIASGISNPPTGSLVSVTQTMVQVPVYSVNGQPYENLAIHPTNGSNVPGSQTTTTSSAPASTTTHHKGAAAHNGVQLGSGGLIAALLGLGVVAL